MKLCMNCQSQLIEKARFCWNCGERQAADTFSQDGPPSIEMSGIRAEISTTRIPSGEWVALGSVVNLPRPLLHPAWLIVGTGTSPESAVDDLRGEMQRRSDQLRRPERSLNDAMAHPIPAL